MFTSELCELSHNIFWSWNKTRIVLCKLNSFAYLKLMWCVYVYTFHVCLLLSNRTSGVCSKPILVRLIFWLDVYIFESDCKQVVTDDNIWSVCVCVCVDGEVVGGHWYIACSALSVYKSQTFYNSLRAVHHMWREQAFWLHPKLLDLLWMAWFPLIWTTRYFVIFVDIMIFPMAAVSWVILPTSWSAWRSIRANCCFTTKFTMC